MEGINVSFIMHKLFFNFMKFLFRFSYVNAIVRIHRKLLIFGGNKIAKSLAKHCLTLLFISAVQNIYRVHVIP